jgi:ATP-dependent DNA helicase RecQ
LACTRGYSRLRIYELAGDRLQLLQAFRAALADTPTDGVVPDKPRETWTPDYAFWRFLMARQDSPDATADHVILLRQALRWSGVTDIVMGSRAGLSTSLLNRAGISVTASRGLVARRFDCDWDLRIGTDTSAVATLDAPPVLVVPSEAEPAEPWLEILPGHGKWRSLAQKDACWMALTAPEGGTTLIALPTGAGKSLAFQAITRFSTGLTVVIVPTIALAIDHRIGSARIFEHMPDVRPMAFESNSVEGDSVRQAIRDRATRLVFASPEACISGSLRGPITEAAKNGWLRTVVIDEAHIVETWGADFRVDFQLLSSALVEWRRLSGGALRTLLLSATFSQECRQTLRELFASDGASWSEFASQRLRPEMNYFVRAFETSDARNSALSECLYHLPRPAIVYATEVAEASSIYQFLTNQLGLKRVALFTGETRSVERKRILESWRADSTDVVVATSAFGMGVDKPDVRSVIHVCVPESLDRYYQEVGRGGRDGASVTCLLMPTPDDWTVARGLTPTLLGDEKIRLRWAALWAGRRAVEGAVSNVFDLPLHSRRAGLFGARSFSENIQWNKRLLLLLVRSGVARLQGIIKREEPEVGEPVADEWARVEILFSTFQDVVGLISGRRLSEIRRASEAFDLLERYVSGQSAICRVLQQKYGPDTARACGTCPSCRTGRARRAVCGPLEVAESLRTNPGIELVTEFLDFGDRRDIDELVMLIRKTVRLLSIRRFFCGGEALQVIQSIFREAFGSDGNELYRLDIGDSRITPTVDSTERIVCIHGPRYFPELERLNHIGRTVTHWVPSGMLRLDANGRQPMIADGASLTVGTEHWLDATMQRNLELGSSVG